MTDHDYTSQGIQEAAAKHAPGIDLPAYFEARDHKGEVAPYVGQDMHAPTNFTPIAVGAAKVVGVGAALVLAGQTFVVGMVTALSWIEANAMYAVAAVVGGVALIGLSAARSSGDSSGGYSGGGSSRGGNCGCGGTTIIQNNNFGGQSAEQNNGR